MFHRLKAELKSENKTVADSSPLGLIWKTENQACMCACMFFLIVNRVKTVDYAKQDHLQKSLIVQYVENMRIHSFVHVMRRLVPRSCLYDKYVAITRGLLA